MSKRDVKLYIVDIFIAVDKIKRYLSSCKDAQALLFDEIRWDATIRELEVIGEATKHLIEYKVLEDKKYRRIVDFRNQINHGYFGIDEEIVWSVATKKLQEFYDDLKDIVKMKDVDLNGTILEIKEEYAHQKEVQYYLDKLLEEMKVDI